MLKIHKSHSKKLLLILITSICITFSLLGLYTLTYTPELSHAETVTYTPPKENRTMANITYMQDITPEICQNSELNKQYTLIDKRDGSDYTVARIKNQTDDEANCWMTQNLRIIDKKISYLDSDIMSTEFTIPPSSINTFNSTTTYELKAYYADNILRGAYYNWYTATAGTGNSSVSSWVDASESICPRGWRLPAGDVGGEFFTLIGNLISGQIINTAPYNFVLSGFVNGSTLKNEKSDGMYWTSTSRGILYAYDFYIISSANNTYDFQPKYNGLSVRCTARNTADNIRIKIKSTISLDVAEEVAVEKSETNPSTADLKVKVSSNQPYVVKLSSDDAAMRSSTTNVTIPAKSGLLNTAENGWGIMKYNASTYTAITSTPELFYEAASPEVKELLLKVGISTVPDLPNGEYSTNITVTATQN